MKKTAISIIIINASLLLFSCNKKEKAIEQPVLINKALTDGFPENIKLINSYLYSCVQTSKYSSTVYNNIFSYAAFTDPEKNLLNTYNHYSNNKIFSSTGAGGNIDVGNVTLNGSLVIKNFSSNSEVYYGGNFSNNTNFLNLNAYWTTEGNRTFKPMDVIINKGHPTIAVNNLAISNSISKNTDFTITIGNNITNYDSLIVILEDGSWNGKIRKTVPKNTASLTFTTQEMSILNNSNNGKFSIYAYNYSNMTVDSKVNVFELSNQYNVNNIYIY